MSKTYPDSIPASFASNDMLANAYRMGWNHGHGLACHNVPKIGETYYADGEGRITADKENIREVHEILCHAAADNARCYSPFEFTAKEFNSCGEGGFRICYDHDDRSTEVYSSREEAEEAAESEGWGGTEIEEVPSSYDLWEAFEQGTADAIAADLAEYTDEDYGIEEDEEG